MKTVFFDNDNKIEVVILSFMTTFYDVFNDQLGDIEKALDLILGREI